MKIVFCSNYMNHHQLYFSLALINQGVDYHFVAGEHIEEERLKLGYEDMNKKYNWIVRAYESKEENARAKELIDDADLVITGSYPMKDIKKRIIKNKPVFLYSERLYKSADGNVDNFYNMHNFLSNFIHRFYFNFFKVYMLCASAYLPLDLSKFNILRGKYYKWGYFPEVKKIDVENVIKSKQVDTLNILWVGRFIDWKHPEYAIDLATYLKDKGYKNIKINMIGTGELLENIKAEVEQKGLLNYVDILGPMHPDEVRQYMEKANIFIFTSDYNEGWGAVLNEAMNSACAIVACSAIGSVPFMLEDKKNGFTYANGDKQTFINKVELLINNEEERNKLSREAYNTVITEWNPENAARKVILLYNKLIEHKNINIDSGVCSKADVIK